MKISIADEDLKKIGIYCIKNLVNNKVYIGSTADSFRKRVATHLRLLLKGRHHSKPLQRAWNKYGSENFEVFIVEIIPFEEVTDNRYVIDVEQTYLDSVDCAYNIAKIAGSRKGVKVSEETLRKREGVASEIQKRIWENMSDEDREKRRKSLREAWENMSEEDYRQKCRIQKEVWENMTPEERKHRSDVQKNMWMNMPEEEYERRCEARQKLWDNMPEEEYERRCNSQKRFWAELSEEEYKEKSKIRKNTWDNMSEETKKKHSDSLKKSWLKRKAKKEAERLIQEQNNISPDELAS